MKLVSADNKILRQVASEIDINDQNKVTEYYNILAHYFYIDVGQRCLGISLPQFGVSARMILCKLADGPVAMVNPKVVFKAGVKMSQEGCETLGGKKNQYLVKRSIIGFVTWYTIHGEKKCGWFTYKQMRIIQHEVDHLNGILIDKGIKV